jgi:hypothetical protein
MSAIRIRVGYDTQGSERDHLPRETNTSYEESKLEICICSFAPFFTLQRLCRNGKNPSAIFVCHFECSEKSKIPHIRSG